MANLTITAGNVLAGSNASVEDGRAGEAMTAGQVVYRSSTTGKYMLADSNSATVEARQARGIALNGGAVDQPVKILKAGDLTVGAILTAGATYFLSDTPGAICPDADVGAGEYVCLLALAKSTSVLSVDIQFPNVSR